VAWGGAICTPDSLSLWTDPLASCPLFFAVEGDRLVFGSRARWLTDLLPSAGGIAALDGPRPLPAVGETAFLGVRAVSPGAVQRFGRAGSRWRVLREERCWSPPACEIVDLAAGRQGVARALETAVDCASEGHERIAVALSGGVDSSSVAALAARSGRRLSTYTVGSPAGAEFAPAASVAEFLGAAHHELIMDASDLAELLPALIDALETWDPLTLQIVAPLAFLYRRMRDPGAVLLTGYGADLVFGSLVDAAAGEPAFEEGIRQGLRSLAVTHELSPGLPADAGVTVRHPFLSAGMLEAGLAVRGRLKSWKGIVKYVLRCAAEDWLPFEVVWRMKVGIHEGSAMATLFAEHLRTTRPAEQARRLREMAEAIWQEAPPGEVARAEDPKCASS
jgi:carbapenam-3-carboxylate synthase